MKQKMTLVGILLAFAFYLASCGGNSQSNVNVPTEYCEELVKLAEGGNAEAQANLGVCYAKGEGVSQSNEEAVRELIDSYPLYMAFQLIIYAPLTEELIFRKSIKDIKNNKIIYIFLS